MIHSSTIRSIALALVLGGGVIAINCSNGGGKVSPPGKLSLAFQLPSGAAIDGVAYDIHAGAPSGIPDVTGHLDTSAANATASFQRVFPASTGDTVTLDATTTTGVACHGVSLPFDVASGGTTRVEVTLTCGAATNPAGPGSVTVNSTVVDGNACPYLTSWVASPLENSIGSTIDVGAAAADLSNPPDTLTLAWTPAANFFAPTAATTKYVCTTAGTHTLTVTVSDNHGSSPCTATVSIDVTCHGIVECGDGIAQFPEQCDPPNGTTCDSTCQLIPGGVTGAGGAAGARGTGGGGGTSGATGTGGVFACNPTGSGGVSGAGAAPSHGCTDCEVAATADGTCFDTSVDGIANGCEGFPDCRRDACYALLNCIRTGNGSGHTCANFDDATPCLCGNLTATACGQSDPTTLPGVCRPQYIAANGGTGTGLFGGFFSAQSPVGIANNMLTCDIDMASDTSLSCPSSVCGVQ